MKLNFNETNILIQVIDDFEKHNKPVSKGTIVSFLYQLMENTDKKYIYVRSSIKSLATKVEMLSENSVTQLQSDVKNNCVVATACYVLPNLN